jgi:aryl-alcohol dehydrogenase-like predicted oxidoreductase
VLLGNRPVNRLGYGVMQLVGPNAWDPPQDRASAIQLLRRSVELGINFFSSANVYGPHAANDLLAAALHPYTDLVIGNKIGTTRDADGNWGLDLRPESLRKELHGVAAPAAGGRRRADHPMCRR